MFTPMGLDHVVFRVRDQAAAQQFYVDVLGCTVDHVNERISLIHLRFGECYIDLLPATPEAPAAAGGVDHVCLSIRCDDLAKVADALRLPTRAEMLGDALVLGGAVCWGATTVAIKANRRVHLTPNKTLFYQLAGSALILLPLSAALGEPGVLAPSAVALTALAYQIVIVAFVSYLAWFWLLARYPASELSAFSFLTPLFGMAAGGLVLGERIGPALTIAMAFVAVGIYLVNRPAAATSA